MAAGPLNWSVASSPCRYSWHLHCTRKDKTLWMCVDVQQGVAGPRLLYVAIKRMPALPCDDIAFASAPERVRLPR